MIMAEKNKKALCYGQRFGHNFTATDSKCGDCGITRDELKSGLQKIEYFVKRPARGIHTETHALAKEISEFCGEPKKFAMYLGVIQNMGLVNAYRVFAEIKQSENIETPGKLFLYLSSPKNLSGKQTKKPEINIGPKSKSKKHKIGTPKKQ